MIAIFLRLYGLDRQSIWYDEYIEESNFQVLVDNIFYNIRKTPDIAPPLNSFFVYMVARIFPSNDLALRIPSFIFGLISIPLFFLLGRSVFNEKVGLLSSFLLAISPFHIWYSQDARIYALLWMLSLLSLIFFLRILKQPSLKNYVGYFICTEASLYTHTFAVFLVLAQAVYVVFFYRIYKSQVLKWLGIFISLAILYLPWLIYSLTSEIISKAPGAFVKPRDIKLFLYTIFAYGAGFSIGPSLRELHLDQSLTVIKPYFLEMTLLITIYSTLFLIGLSSLRKEGQKLVLLLSLLTIPVIATLVLTIIRPDIAYNVRYTGFSFFAFLLFISKGTDCLTDIKSHVLGRMFAIFSVVSLTVFSAYSYINYQFDKRYHKEDVRTAASYIKENKQNGDVILVITSTCSLVLNRYLDGDLQSIGYPPLDTNNRKEIIRVLEKIVDGKKRLWLVLCREWYQKNLTDYTKQWLDKNFNEIKELRKGPEEIANLTIYCYNLKQ